MSVNAAYDETRLTTDVHDAELGDFFSRPLKIASYEWSPSIRLYEEFDPWSLYLENPRVINRINNFYRLKGQLHVKFMINGNAFYYGRLLANYKPFEPADDLTLDRGLVEADNVEASLRPHLFIDPTTNQGGEIHCPFLWYKDTVSIVDGEWSSLGKISLRELNQLRHANGATDPITISVFAWMSDVVLTVPTANDATDLVAQAGMEGGKKKARVTKTSNKTNKNTSKLVKQDDEYGSGPVSGPASTVARIAGMLDSAPIIGPYAKATQIAASGIANVAKLFGYSRPPSLAPDTVMMNRPLYGMASSNLADQTENLALDAKQELTVDGTVVGLDNTDEMTIKSIATRETYLDKTTWTTSDPVDQVLFSMGVSPCQTHQYAPGGGAPAEYHVSAAKFAAMPFEFWRGSTDVRFQIVSSAYHKGRIKIQWDPYGYATQESNVQYTQIVDISEEKDFTINIGWGNNRSWLDVPGLTAKDYEIRATEPTNTDSFQRINGVLTVSVLNTLTSPSLSAGDTIEMNVFVSAGDDFEVAAPTSAQLERITYFQPEFTPQAGFEYQSGTEGSAPAVQQDADCTDEPSKPVQESRITTFGAPNDTTDHLSDVYMGEKISSFRSCLKRYQYVGALPAGVLNNSARTEFHTFHYPPIPGKTSEAYWCDPAAQTYNYCEMSLMAYLYPAYAIMRGGVRWRDAIFNPGFSAYDMYPYIRRNNTELGAFGGFITRPDVGAYDTQTITSSTVGDICTGSRNYYPNTWDGIATNPKQQNSVVYADIPYQVKNRFKRARNVTRTPTNSDCIISHGAVSTCNSSQLNTLMCFCAASEDFSLHMFLGQPVMWDITS